MDSRFVRERKRITVRCEIMYVGGLCNFYRVGERWVLINSCVNKVLYMVSKYLSISTEWDRDFNL